MLKAVTATDKEIQEFVANIATLAKTANTMDGLGVKISLGITKLGVTIPSVNLPPILTCRPFAPCAKGCYACKGHFCLECVKNVLEYNYKSFMQESKQYFDFLHNWLKINLGYKYFRFHSSGDIINTNYLVGMINLAKKNKGIKFLCFTKQYEIVNNYLDIEGNKFPSNLKIVLSNWGSFICPNPHNLPVTYVRFGKWLEEAKRGDNELIPDDAIPCCGKCYQCFACWNLKAGQAVQFKKH